MGYVKIWIHLVWTTKRRRPILTEGIRRSVIEHIRKNATEKDIYIDTINGYFDHIHCLISLGSSQSIDRVAMLLKGESSYWINKQKLTKRKFMWQSDYFAKSVSVSVLEQTRTYIRNQEKHHSQK